MVAFRFLMTTHASVFLAAAAPVLFVIAALVARLEPGRRIPRLSRALSIAAAGGVLVSFATIVAVAMAGPMTSPSLGGLGLRLDPLSVTLSAMVALLAAVIVRFSRTYLDGDPRRGVFLGRLAATIASVQVLVLADHLVLFVGAWMATSLTLHRLLVFYGARRGAVVAARKKFIVARLGDACLIGAAIWLYAAVGSGDFGALFAASLDGATITGVGILLAVTALLKSAQFPTHGWLIEVMETPTPVSALLHAGLLNAGPFLIVRFAPIASESALASGLLVVGGGFTALFASAALLTQPAVKTALGYSSAAHMGFMLLVSGLGVYPAVILHLVAHSFYKAHAFLSAGSAVETAVAARVVPPTAGGGGRLAGAVLRLGRAVLGAGLALGIYAGLALLFGGMLPSASPLGDPALLLVGAMLVLGLTQLLTPALDRGLPWSTATQIAGLTVAVGLAFFALETATAGWLAASLPPRTVPPTSVLVAAGLIVASFAVAIGLQLVGAGRTRTGRALYLHLRQGFYANALFDRLVGTYRR